MILGRYRLTFLRWLTATMTLVAGLPHWECACFGADPELRGAGGRTALLLRGEGRTGPADATYRQAGRGSD